jgi:hypothetical protein
VATAATFKMADASKKPQVIWPLMGPYLGWVAFATVLNAELLRENSTVRRRDAGRILWVAGAATGVKSGRSWRGPAPSAGPASRAAASCLRPARRRSPRPRAPPDCPPPLDCQETWLDWRKVSKDIDEKTAPARAAAKDAADKAAVVAKETADKAAAAAKDAAEKAAAKTREAGGCGAGAGRGGAGRRGAGRGGAVCARAAAALPLRCRGCLDCRRLPTVPHAAPVPFAPPHAADKAAAAASAVATEVRNKAAHDMAELKQALE